MAGSVAAVITTPIDVVKTRLMLTAADTGESAASENISKAARTQGKDVQAEIERAKQAARAGGTGAVAVAKHVLQTEGVKGLFRGGSLRGVWTALGSGLYLGVYESGHRSLETRRVNEGTAVS